MKNVEIFHNIEFGSVRVLEDGDRLLFCGNDVAAALGYPTISVTKQVSPQMQS